ncbi:MAG: QueT transporter family protein [Spirochaetales bacterium]|nr:QueT transporter family protein [Spirochaetales bacterium]
MKHSALYIAEAAIIAALYAALTWLGNTVGVPAIGPVEFRFSEALTILPIFTNAAIPGLTIGCFLANLICGGVVWDLVFGSLATLLGAIGTYLLRKFKVLPFLPPIVSNTLIIPPILLFAYGFGEGTPTWLFYLIFFAGEALSVLVLGYILKLALDKTKVFPKLHRREIEERMKQAEPKEE